MYPVFIHTIEHNPDSFTWEGRSDDYGMLTGEAHSENFKTSTLTMFTNWTLCALLEEPKQDHQFPKKMQQWLDINLSSDYTFGAVGYKSKTHIYGYFKSPDDAALFKLTWANNAKY